MFERFTDEARQVVLTAVVEARQTGDDFVGTEHLLLGLLRVQHGLADELLQGAGVSYAPARSAVLELNTPAVDDDALAAIGIDADQVRRVAEASFGPGALERAVGGPRKRSWGTRFTEGAKMVLELSLREAVKLKAGHIGTEHLLLALVGEDHGLGSRILRRLAPETDFRQLVLQQLRRAS